MLTGCLVIRFPTNVGRNYVNKLQRILSVAKVV